MCSKKQRIISLILLCGILGTVSGCRGKHAAENSAVETDPTSSKIVVNGAKIVTYFTGMTEDAFKKATNVTVDYDQKTGCYRAVIKAGKAGPFSKDSNGNFILKNAQTGSSYNAGQFETYLHEKLIEETGTYTAKKPGTFNVVTASVDTMTLQNQAAARGEKAVFLVASDYDGIEAVSGNSVPSIAIYLGDVIQGPFGCFPGALLRLYSQIRENTRVATNSFDPQNPRVHMLKSDFLDTQNGYPYLNKNITFYGNIETFLKSNNYSFSIMYHKNQSAPIKGARIGNGFEAFVIPSKQPEYTVDQIFSAGLSLGAYKTGFMNGYAAPEVFIEALAQKILFDIYDSAIRAAIKNNRDTVYLLPIGCGVFGNKKIWAGMALERCKELIVKSGLTIKYVISESEYDEFLDILTHLVKETGGEKN
ncbi:TPA: hypothetical protein DDZ86_01525 [Candidatus Dependentiae bacterium]|nr:MAG: hypothetical protein UW09_C0001G0332 [candidate division TM6 bacterium GW2011_GWF2_43_87]HBL98304.1 hypothetical protein [Candidatus Dependentiae bacterium]